MRYSLTSWVMLIGEYIHTKSEAHNGNQAEADTVALGAILFFMTVRTVVTKMVAS